jgi:predicted SprT family Zn-dependent metalloprotease
MDRSNHKPTDEQFGAYQAMFDFLNARLFGGELPAVILNFSRKARTLGFFAPERWERSDGTVVHEISLNPRYLRERGPRDAASTLAHEMAHLWQQVYGKPGRGGYHNRQWAAKMDDIGLTPSSTGAEGGKRTGDRVSHFIVDGGPFDVAFAAMPAECLLPWACGEPDKAAVEKPRSKVKYSCGTCGINAWGKPELAIICGECGEQLEEAE